MVTLMPFIPATIFRYVIGWQNSYYFLIQTQANCASLARVFPR